MCVRGIASELDRSFFQRSLSNGMTRQLRLTTHASLMAEQMLTNLKKKLLSCDRRSGYTGRWQCFGQFWSGAAADAWPCVGGRKRTSRSSMRVEAASLLLSDPTLALPRRASVSPLSPVPPVPLPPLPSQQGRVLCPRRCQMVAPAWLQVITRCAHNSRKTHAP